jgi:hypothetical protein
MTDMIRKLKSGQYRCTPERLIHELAVGGTSALLRRGAARRTSALCSSSSVSTEPRPAFVAATPETA